MGCGGIKMQATYVSANSFTVVGDRTSEFTEGRRLKADMGIDGIGYLTVASSSFAANTTVVTKESQLTANLTEVLYGVVQPGVTGSLPDHTHGSDEGDGGYIRMETTLSGLDGTPNDYGTSGYFLQSTGAGTQWASPSAVISGGLNFTDLNDTPSDYGVSGNILQSTGSGIEWTSFSQPTSSGVPSLISEDTTLYLSVSGSDTLGDGSLGDPWQTFNTAWDYLKDKIIQTDKTVTIQYLDGTHVVGSTISSYPHPNGSQITIAGETVLERNITSVQSSSGGAGAYSIVFNVDSVADIDVGDYVVVTSDAAGGSNPDYACGCHEITNVDGVNTRITVLSKHQSGVPSGAVTASILIFKTILDCLSNGIYVNEGNTINIKDIVLVNSLLTGNGLYARNNSTISCTAPIGISGFGSAVYADAGAVINFTGCGASGGGGHRLMAIYAGIIYAQYSVLTGAGAHGALAYYNSTISANYTVATGNTGSGLYSGYNSHIHAADSTSTGNGDYGWRSAYNAGVRRTGAVTGGNNGSGYNILESTGGYVQT